MPGDAKLGAVLRELRTARRLTLTAVAGQARCTLSLLSYVENGHRQLQVWLAEELDRMARTRSLTGMVNAELVAVPPEPTTIKPEGGPPLG